jgi:hypothetical protein
MDSFKIEFHECSTLSDSADAESSEFSEPSSSSNACSPLIRENSQVDEKTTEDAFAILNDKRMVYKKKQTASMY